MLFGNKVGADYYKYLIFIYTIDTIILIYEYIFENTKIFLTH